jgi:alcohol dehydrogenase class IV
VSHPDDLDARADCQFGSLMSGVSGINAMVSLVHAIGHVVGGRLGLQHGLSHAILLAPVMRTLLPAIGADQFFVLEAMGGHANGQTADQAGAAAADAMAELVASLPLPQRLKDVGVDETDLDDIAAATMDDYMMGFLPRPVTQAEVLSALKSVF